MSKVKILLLVFVLAPLSVAADDITFAERFALSPDRSQVLKDLIPGTKDYYYYHCLHYQHTRDFAKVRGMLALWIRRAVLKLAAIPPVNRAVGALIAGKPDGAPGRK